MHLGRCITEVILGSKASFIFILCYFFLRLEQHKLSLMAEEWRSGNLVHKLLPKHHFKSQNWGFLGGSVVKNYNNNKNLPVDAEDMGSISGALRRLQLADCTSWDFTTPIIT